MRALKVKDVYEIMRHEIREGRGDYAVLVTDDDEANGYHYLWFGAQPITEAEKPIEYNGRTIDCTIYTSDNVTSHDKHIIIG